MTGTSTLKEPSAAAFVATCVVAESWSVFVAATKIRLPGALVPVTVSGEWSTDDSSAGLVTVSVVAPTGCAT